MESLIINKQDVVHNLRVLQEKVSVPVIGVVKGDGLGLGLVPLAQTLVENGVNMLAVDDIASAQVLREAGAMVNILILRPITTPQQAQQVLALNLWPLVGEYESMRLMEEAASAADKVADIQLFLDTGFGGYGFATHQVGQVPAMLMLCPHVRVWGTATHFATAFDKNEKYINKQYARFVDALNLLKSEGVQTGMRHACASWAALKFPHMHLDAVRVGSVFGGRLPGFGLLPVGKLTGKVLTVFDLKKGECVGYGATARMKQDGSVAVIGMGYAQGVGLQKRQDAFRLKDKLRFAKTALTQKPLMVTINGRVAPVLGRVNMHHFVVHVDASVQPGDAFTMACQPLFISPGVPRVWQKEVQGEPT